MQIHLVEYPFTPDPAAIIARLGLESDSDEAADFAALLEKAAPLARPAAVHGAARVEAVDAETGSVTLGGEEFKSRLLAKNLAGQETAWPYVASCGRELYDFVQAIPDPFERYWGEEIMQEALRAAYEGLGQTFHETVYSGKTAAMSPGSLEDWPIQEQVPLFRLLEDGPARIGVSLTETLLMLPNKSISGIRFPNEEGYVNCRLCPKQNCPNRKAEYDAEVAAMMNM